MTYKTRRAMIEKTNSWLRGNRIKAFYTPVDGASFQDGATSLLQASGVGKLKPNILLMGYKNDWASCPWESLDMYFNVMQWVFIINQKLIWYVFYNKLFYTNFSKSLDMHIAVALLRVNDTLECNGDRKANSTIPMNPSFSQLSQGNYIWYI